MDFIWYSLPASLFSQCQDFPDWLSWSFVEIRFFLLILEISPKGKQLFFLLLLLNNTIINILLSLLSRLLFLLFYYFYSCHYYYYYYYYCYCYLLCPKMDLAEMHYYQTIKLGTQSKLYVQNYSQMIFANIDKINLIYIKSSGKPQ